MRRLWPILLIALLNGLVYVFLVPPWQHYDEPNHFEYAWLVAHRPGWPQEGDFDREMRVATLRSMIGHDFFRGMGWVADMDAPKPWIGQYAQVGDPPLYYFLAALPLRLFPPLEVTAQLYAARLVSLGLYLLTVLAAWGAMAGLLPPRHPLRVLVPLSLALLPAFTDLMTAVNSDAGAVAVFSLFLWGSVRLIRRGPSFGEVLWVLLAAAGCAFTKRTVYVALPLTGMVFLLAFLRGRWRKLAWGLLLASAMGALAAILAWGDAALWYRNTPQNVPTRVLRQDAPSGEYAFRLVTAPEEDVVKLVQIIPPHEARLMSGKPCTLGFWVWASAPVEITAPRVHTGDRQRFGGEPLAVDQTPRFHAFTFTLQGNTARVWVELSLPKDLNPAAPVEVFYDGLVLAEGAYPDAPPDATLPVWGAAPYRNMLRNASAERAWPYLRPWADALATRLFGDYRGQESFSLALYTLLDWPSSGWYYRGVAVRLLRTFWARFGWGHVPLLAGKGLGKPYRLLAVITLVGLGGVLLALWQRRSRLRELPWGSLGFLTAAAALVWGTTLMRGATYVLVRPLFPVARYAYPAIVPTMFFLSLGWLAWLRPLERRLHLPIWGKYALHGAFFGLVDLYALLSIYVFYFA